MIPNFTFAIGYMIMSWFSMLFPDWRQLTLFITALTFPFLLTWWLWPESPRYLYQSGKFEEAEKVMKHFFKKCGMNWDSEARMQIHLIFFHFSESEVKVKLIHFTSLH